MIKDNMNNAKELCEALNKYFNYESITFCESDLEDDIRVRRIFDTRGLAYDEVYFTYEKLNKYSLEEIVNLVIATLEKEECKTVFPTQKAIELYDKLKINCWFKEGIRIEEEDFYIKEEAWSSIHTMEFIKINKDTIEIIMKEDVEEEGITMIIKRGLEVNIEDGKMIPFNVMLAKEEEEKFVRHIVVDEIEFKTSTGKIYSSDGELRYNDKLGDEIVCDLDNLTKITYVANENAYMVGTVFDECMIFN
ncbi:hypothetical protein ACN077_03250 [Clostridium chromiireducens]|uniref:hypothetical protein n=1 Tax=Clostridium chromiireducens TaxID=225345 RepID=UPI003AF619D6